VHGASQLYAPVSPSSVCTIMMPWSSSSNRSGGSDASKAERGSEESALDPSGAKYASVSSTEVNESSGSTFRARHLRVQVKHKEKESKYETAAKVGIATILMGPVGLAGGLAYAATKQVDINSTDEVILPPTVPRLAPASSRAKCWLRPLVIGVTSLLMLGDVVLQTISAAVSIVQGWLLSYVVYFCMGETIKVSRAAFSYSSRFTEVVLTGVVIANPEGDYKTPYFLMLDRLEIHLELWKIMMAILPCVWDRSEGMARNSTITIPYIWVSELTLFFEKPAKSEEQELNLDVEPDYRLNAWKLCKLQKVPGGREKMMGKIREVYRRAAPLNWVLGDVELRQVHVFATDLIAELLGCEYGCGLDRAVYSPVQIPTFTIDRREETLHPDLQETDDDKEGLPTAVFVSALRKLLAAKIDISPAIKAVLATQKTFLGGKATVEQAQAHIRDEFDRTEDTGAHSASEVAELV